MAWHTRTDKVTNISEEGRAGVHVPCDARVGAGGTNWAGTRYGFVKQKKEPTNQIYMRTSDWVRMWILSIPCFPSFPMPRTFKYERDQEPAARDSRSRRRRRPNQGENKWHTTTNTPTHSRPLPLPSTAPPGSTQRSASASYPPRAEARRHPPTPRHHAATPPPKPTTTTRTLGPRETSRQATAGTL